MELQILHASNIVSKNYVKKVETEFAGLAKAILSFTEWIGQMSLVSSSDGILSSHTADEGIL